MFFIYSPWFSAAEFFFNQVTSLSLFQSYTCSFFLLILRASSYYVIIFLRHSYHCIELPLQFKYVFYLFVSVALIRVVLYLRKIILSKKFILYCLLSYSVLFLTLAVLLSIIIIIMYVFQLIYSIYYLQATSLAIPSCVFAVTLGMLIGVATRH